MTFGIVESGFNKKKLEDILEEMDTTLKNVLGQYINLLPTSVVGQLKYTYAEREADIWDLLEAIYNSQFLDSSTGVSFDNALAFIGMTRKGATYSTVSLRIYGDKNTSIDPGFKARNPTDASAVFVTMQPVVIGDGIDAEQRILFSAEPDFGNWSLVHEGNSTSTLANNATNTDVQNALNAVPSLSGVLVTGSFVAGFFISYEGDDGEKPQELLTVDINTLEVGGSGITIDIDETQKGYLPFADADSTCENLGPIQAAAGTVTEITTPQLGVTGVENILDATVGSNRETVAEAKVRKVTFIQKTGSATPDKIRAAVLAVDGVSKSFVVENTDDEPDTDGRPPKCFEVFAVGGNTQEIGQAIWDTKGAGIQPYGTVSVGVIDSEGVNQTVAFSRPEGIEIYLVVDLLTNNDENVGAIYPEGGDELVEQAILDFAGGYYDIGKDVINNLWFTPINTVPGIIGITVKQGFSAAPTQSNNLTILGFQVHEFDTSRITINKVNP